MKKDNMLLAGESANVEYKQDIPEDHLKFIKTVVAFANGKGGKLVFGVEDGSLNVTGFSREDVFVKQDAITNAIYDSCEPKIMPEVTVQPVNGRWIVTAEIPAGMQTPYFVKSMGMVDGTFIRVSGTTHHADKVSLQELILKGTNRSFDQLEAEDTVTEAEVEVLCDRLYEHAKEIAMKMGHEEPIRKVGVNQLLSWKLLVRKADGLHPTNGYYLLDGRNDIFPCAVVQCGAFKGTTREVFLDRKEFEGPIFQQLEDAYTFLLRHLNMESTIEGLYRKDQYELPVRTIRELLANAFCSRSYLAEKKIQVMLYSDRLEITSPGRLDDDLTIDELKTGISKIRNKALAAAFSYMFLIEGWGTGIPKMYEQARAYGLPEPEILTMGNSFRVNLYRPKTTPVEDVTTLITTPVGNVTTLDTTPVKDVTTPVEISNKEKLYNLICTNPTIKKQDLAIACGITIDGVKYNLRKLANDGFVVWKGNSKTGHWVVLKEYSKKR